MNYLVHCISSDFAMGAGIAKEFAARGVKIYLTTHCKRSFDGKGYVLYAPISEYRGVYNLVTKAKYWQKPTYETLTQALEDLKLRIAVVEKAFPDEKPMRIAMPQIGCGLDRLEWSKVRKIIQTTFEDTDVEILVCKL